MDFIEEFYQLHVSDVAQRHFPNHTPSLLHKLLFNTATTLLQIVLPTTSVSFDPYSLIHELYSSFQRSKFQRIRASASVPLFQTPHPSLFLRLPSPSKISSTSLQSTTLPWEISGNPLPTAFIHPRARYPVPSQSTSTPLAPHQHITSASAAPH